VIKRDAPALGALETDLARLDAALTALPPGERQEILLETRSHVVEQTRRSPSRSADDVLEELGCEGDAHVHVSRLRAGPRQVAATDHRK
jgi:uncharacterized membrane protein